MNIKSRGNEYIRALHSGDFDKIPKAVFAAIAMSFAYRNVEEKNWDAARDELLNEWRALYENGIVPQRPPKETSANA